MALIIVSFLAWVLTILAPCVLPLLPIILWTSLENSKDKYKPYVIISSLLVSVIVFSILLKATTLFLWVDPIIWKIISWTILIFFWLITIFWNFWKKISWPLSLKSNEGLTKSSWKKWVLWNILVWASLWPVFSSCSPTYAIVLAVILPVSFFVWLINLIAYAIWLWVMLLLIALLWQKFIWNLKWVSNPNWIFKKFLWAVFVLVWLAIITGYDKAIETKILDSWYFDITAIEQKLLDNIEIKDEWNFDLNNINNNTSENLINTGNQELEKKEFWLLNSWLKTNTNKISIDFNEILSWWPWKDWIPAINNPSFVDMSVAKKELSFLKEESFWVSIEYEWDVKFYPYEILVWHEIVNDVIWNKKISVTFCPLCWSAIVFDRDLAWEEVNFWVSWKLYQSNLLMYDDLTESLWSQSLWEAVVWDYLWTKLQILKSNVLTFKDFKSNYKSWKVLSDKTWFSRSYWTVPYWDYDDNQTLYFPIQNNTDTRFHLKEIFYVINDWDESIAFLLNDLRNEWLWAITIWQKKYEATYIDWIVDVKLDSKIINWYYEMWFSWVNHNEWSKNVWSSNIK